MIKYWLKYVVQRIVMALWFIIKITNWTTLWAVAYRMPLQGVAFFSLTSDTVLSVNLHWTKKEIVNLREDR
jgi:hypothetical protein